MLTPTGNSIPFSSGFCFPPGTARTNPRDKHSSHHGLKLCECALQLPTLSAHSQKQEPTNLAWWVDSQNTRLTKNKQQSQTRAKLWNTLQLGRHSVQYQFALGHTLASQCPNQVDAGHGGPLPQTPPSAPKFAQVAKCSFKPQPLKARRGQEPHWKNNSKCLLMGPHEN